MVLPHSQNRSRSAVAGTVPSVLAVTTTHGVPQQRDCPLQPGLVSLSFLTHCPPTTVSTWGSCGQSRGCAGGGGTDQGGEEKLCSLQACPALGLMLCEAKEGKQSFSRHQSQRSSVPSGSPATVEGNSPSLGKEGYRGSQGREET